MDNNCEIKKKEEGKLQTNEDRYKDLQSHLDSLISNKLFFEWFQKNQDIDGFTKQSFLNIYNHSHVFDINGLFEKVKS